MKSRPQATSKLLTETDRTIVTEWRFAPGAETGWHRHAHDYVVVVLTAGKLMQETANGEIVTELAMGAVVCSECRCRAQRGESEPARVRVRRSRVEVNAEG